MDRVIYERTTSLNGSVIGSDDYLAVTKKASLRHRILLSPVVKYGATTLFAIACLMTVVYLSMYFALNNATDIWISTCNIRGSYRVDCFPGRLSLSYDECNNADCCWDEEEKFCYHSIPSRHGYTGKNGADNYQENDILVPRRTSSPFGKKNVESLSLHLTKHSDPNHIEFTFKINPMQAASTGTFKEKQKNFVNELSEMKKVEKVNTRENGPENLLHFLPQSPARRTSNVQTDPNSNMNVYVHMPEFSVTVTRKNDTSKSLLSTARGPLILTEHFWEMTLYITNSTVYGLNQLELNGTTSWIYDNENGTSRIAFLGITDTGESTSCYVDHYGPMEIKVIDESNLIVLRGFSLSSEISVHVFAGPTPLEAIQQLTKALRENDDTIESIELSNLGLHVCPNEKSDNFIESLEHLIEAINDTPWDSHCIHQDFDPTMGNEPMSSSNKVIIENAIKRLNSENEKRSLVPHLTPMVFGANNMLAFNLSKNSLLLQNYSKPYGGLYRKKQAFYPDWHNKKTHEESLPSLNVYLENFGNATFVYLRDSWPKDETKGLPVPDHSTFDYLPLMLQNLMGNATVPYTLVSSARGKSHYIEHGLYSSDFSNFVRQRGDLTSLVVRGLWGESGNSSWAALAAAIRAGVGSGIVGQLPSPMYACGTGEELPPGTNSDELCSRWFGASIAWPHVLAIPSNLPGGDHLTGTSKSYIKQHLRRRSSLVTYVRTLIAQFYDDGSPILAPTSIYYPQELRARHTPNQFMWGYGILVGLVTLPKVKQVSMFIPGKNPWRHLFDRIEVNPSPMGLVPINAYEGEIVTLIKPGSIIPIHENLTMTSATTIQSGLTLYIHKACDGLVCNASGKIFYGSHVSDGEFLLLSATYTTLKLSNIVNVKKKACTATNPIEQSTTIRKIIVYNNPDIKSTINICNITNETYEIPLL